MSTHVIPDKSYTYTYRFAYRAKRANTVATLSNPVYIKRERMRERRSGTEMIFWQMISRDPEHSGSVLDELRVIAPCPSLELQDRHEPCGQPQLVHASFWLCARPLSEAEAVEGTRRHVRAPAHQIGDRGQVVLCVRRGLVTAQRAN